MGKKGDVKSNKTVQKEKEKKVEDLTFGLKNKNKSKQVQKFVESIKSTVMQKNDNTKFLENQAKKANELKKEQDKLLLANLG